MKALLVEKFVTTYSDIQVSEIPGPVPQRNQVLVEVKAAGLNFVDLLYARGKHQNNRSLVVPPFILGLEFSGVVISSHVPGFSAGDRVFGSHQGSFSERIVVNDGELRKVPKNWTYIEAAGLAATAPVSYGALVVRGFLQAGETVLIHAAAGGLGLMAVQIAKAMGATVIATASTSEKLKVAQNYGADYCVNYEKSNWWEEILRITGQQGVDLVYDPVGKVNESLKCLKHKGRVLIIGFAGTEGNIEKIATNRILLKQAVLIGYRYGESNRRYPEETELVWSGLSKMFDEGSIRPTVYDQAYHSLSSVSTAMEDLASRKTWGKAVVELSGSPNRARI